MTGMNDRDELRVEAVMFSEKDSQPLISGMRVLSTQPISSCFMLRGLPSVSRGTARVPKYGSRALYRQTRIPRPSASNYICSIKLTDIIVPLFDPKVVQ